MWAAGQTLLGSAPSAHAANLAPAALRPQALAVMRTAGDVGLLVGATTIGSLATLIGQDAAMQSSAAALIVFAAAYSSGGRGSTRRVGAATHPSTHLHRGREGI
mmetsp:Transcript_4513/g.13659  ORF Transcript_4513/g.13659 Transcript_4513/m.13659 type:complete len:104 (+) Transcript_4513:1785-2096(+)